MPDTKLTGLTAGTSANDGDIFYYVTDTGGTPTGLKISKVNLLSGIQRSVAIPLVTGSGGTGRTTIGSAHTILGVNSSEASLTYYAILASNNATVTKSGTAIYISANSASIAGKQDSLSIPLITTSGGTGRITVGSAHTLLGVNSDGSSLSYYAILASDNTTIVKSGTAIFISASTGAGGSSVVYAATANSYVVISAAADLTAERTLSSSTGLTLVDGGANSSVSLSVNQNVRTRSAGFFVGGNLSTSHISEESRVYIPFNLSASRVSLSIGTSASGASTIIDILQYNHLVLAGTSMFAANGDKPFIPAGASAGSSTTFTSINTFYAGSYLGFNIDQVGSVVPGSNLTITIIGECS